MYIITIYQGYHSKTLHDRSGVVGYATTHMLEFDVPGACSRSLCLTDVDTLLMACYIGLKRCIHFNVGAAKGSV